MLYDVKIAKALGKLKREFYQDLLNRHEQLECQWSKLEKASSHGTDAVALLVAQDGMFAETTHAFIQCLFQVGAYPLPTLMQRL